MSSVDPPTNTYTFTGEPSSRFFCVNVTRSALSGIFTHVDDALTVDIETKMSLAVRARVLAAFSEQQSGLEWLSPEPFSFYILSSVHVSVYT